MVTIRLEGKQMDDVTKLAEQVEHTIPEQEIMVLSARDSTILAEALLNPKGPNAALRAAFEDYKTFVGQTGE